MSSIDINASDLRAHLFSYLKQVEHGEEIHVLWRGREIARIVPPKNEKEKALQALKELRKKCYIGDIVSPIGDEWEANK